jgi:hypothetical protein
MDKKSDKDFGKRKPVSVPVATPAPPAKRSGRVALLLMGTFAVGSAAYALMPNRSCERPPNAPQPSLLQGNANGTECPPRSSSSSSSHGGSGGSSSSRSSYYSSDSSSSHSSTATSDSGSHAVARGGFGALAHSFGSHFSSGG